LLLLLLLMMVMVMVMVSKGFYPAKYLSTYLPSLSFAAEWEVG